jgi:hypothetical protein
LLKTQQKKHELSGVYDKDGLSKQQGLDSAAATLVINTVKCFVSHVSEVAFPGQRIWKFVGNRLVEAHICGNGEAKETELLQMGIPFAALPWLLTFRSNEI